MRKISSILTLLFLCLYGNLSAQELTRLTTIADGVYYLGCPANGGHAYYDGTNQYLRRTASPEENGKFTITQGIGEYVGYYTIQTYDGNYVVAGSDIANHTTVAGTNVKVVASGQETDDNKWWAFTVDASNASYVDIFPKQQTLTTTTPAWNFASDHNGANQAVGLYGANDNNSNWILVTTKRAISMNFGNQGSALYSDGINKVPAAAWNNVTATGNTRGDLVIWNGTATETLNNWSVTWSSKNIWNYNTSVKENILKGYLDDGAQTNGNYATVSFTGLPFTTGYDLYIYSATDTENANFRPVSVTMNGHTYTYTTESGVGYFGTSNWGQSRNATSVMGTNVICIKGLTASEITISGGQNSGGARGGIAAVQIVETGASNVINAGNTFDASTVTSPVYLVKDGDLTIQNVTPEIRSKYIDVTGVTGTVTWEGYEDITYTLTDGNGATYNGVYNTYWDGENTECPPMNGVTFTNKVFTNTGSGYTLTANISFPFPVSSNGVKNATGIQSQLGTSKWFKARDFDGYYVTASSDATSKIRSDKPYHNWYIYPTLTDGTFSFKIENADGGYIPQLNNSQAPNTKNYLVEEAEAGVYYFTPCVGAGNSGFSIDSEGTKFLSVNTSGTDQPIWVWTKTGTHQGSNLSFYTPVANYTIENAITDITPYRAIQKFDITAEYETVGPNEFSNPLVINAAIDAALALDLNEETRNDEAIFAYLDSDHLLILKDYQSKLETYNTLTLVTTKFDMKGTYGTLILPCAAVRPAGLKYYTCAEVDGTALVLVEYEGALVEKKPYIVEQLDGAAHNKYAIVGWNRLANTDATTYKIGLLTGVLTAGGETVPDGSYVLARNTTTGKQSFFLTNGSVICPQYKCYLTVGGGATAAKELYFDNEGTTTGIEAIFGGENEEVVIYDLSGKRLSRLQKGVNIVNGHKVIVK